MLKLIRDILIKGKKNYSDLWKRSFAMQVMIRMRKSKFELIRDVRRSQYVNMIEIRSGAVTSSTPVFPTEIEFITLIIM